MNCSTGIKQAVNKYVTDKPYLRFNGNDFIEIQNSPKGKINSDNFMGVANSVSSTLNKAINSDLPLGKVFYPINTNGVVGVAISPTDKQLSLLNAKDQEEIKEALMSLNEETPEKDRLDLENDTTFNVDENGDSNIFYQENVNYALKAADILQSPQAIQIFEKGNKNNWTLDKILTELSIPKDQKEILLQLGQTNREDLLTSLLSNFSYTVEINTAKKFSANDEIYANTGIFNYNGNKYSTYDDSQSGEDNPIYLKDGENITRQEFQKTLRDSGTASQTLSTDFYSNLTVSGGTNYTENEIAIPNIVPSIKGHAQFSTDNGIGWFRSDEQRGKNILSEADKEAAEAFGLDPEPSGVTFEKTKTRRILEVQSDLFQKGRDSKYLTDNSRDENEFIETGNTSFKSKNKTAIQENQFLQLLNKDNNWVTFFIKSIIQDSAKKGYESVLFPTGDTASKVEGHETLEGFIKIKQDRIDYLNKAKENIKSSLKEIRIFNDGLGYSEGIGEFELIYDFEGYDYKTKKEVQHKIDIEIKQVKQELENINTNGIASLAPIYNFYENQVKNILKKNYSINEITDEYGNTWNQVSLKNIKNINKILLQKQNKTISSSASPKTISLTKEFLKRVGVDVKTTNEIIVDGKIVDANAIANITKGLIEVTQGKEATSLPEEAMHFAVEIIQQKNPGLFNQLLKEINSYNILKDVMRDYSSLKEYQTPDGKPDILKLKKEAIGKVLAESVINQNEGLTENPELLAKTEEWWNKILNFLRNLFITSGFDKASMDILTGKDIGTMDDVRNKNNNNEKNTYLQKQAEQHIAEEITNSFKSIEKPNERKFNKPTNLPEDFRLLQRTGTNQYTTLLSTEKNQLGDYGKVQRGKSSESIPYFKGIFGRTFKELLSSSERGTSLEGTNKRYANLRIIQSLSENPFLRDLASRLGLGEIRIVNNGENVPKNPLFVQGNENVIYINEDEWLKNLQIKFDRGVNLDEYTDLVVFEELIHILTNKIINRDQLNEASNELSPSDKQVIDSFYLNKNDLLLSGSIHKYNTINELIRMKVQKDLGGKSTEDLVNNIVTKIWDFIMSLFKNKLVKTNKIADDVKNYILNKKDESNNNSSDGEILGLPPINTKQDQVYNRIKELGNTITKNSDGDGYSINGRKIKRRVSDLVHDWYSRRFADKSLTKDEFSKAVDDLKAEKGTAGHADLEHAFSLFVDENGYVRDSPLNDDGYISLLNPDDRSMYNLLRDNLEKRIDSFPKGKFMSEQIIYDAKRDIAGTVDFLAITPDGKVSILDWKFIDLNTDRYKDIPWYKVNAWHTQMEQYKYIVHNIYNVKNEDFEQTRMIPIKALYTKGDRDENILPKLVSVKIGDVNVKNIEEDYLIPVGLEGEKTGNKKIDALLEKLNAIYKKFSAEKVVDSEKLNKAEQLNALFSAIRQLQMKQNIVPLINQARILNKQIQDIIEKYNNKFKGQDATLFSQKEINDFTATINTGLEALNTYINLDTELRFLFEGTLSDEDKKTKEDLKGAVDDSRNYADLLKDVDLEFTNDIIAGSEKVENVSSPEKVVRGVTKYFGTGATIQLKSLETLFKKANKAFAYAGMDILTESKKLFELKNSYQKWAKNKGLTIKNQFDIIKKKDKNELIDEFNPEFYSTLKKKIDSQDFKWIRENVDAEAYKEFIKEQKKIEYQRIENKPRLGTEAENIIDISREKAQANALYDVSTPTSVGWLLKDKIQKFPKKELWQSKEWKELNKPENKPALDFYNYIIERNKYYAELGYINSLQARTFIPNIRRGVIEKLSFGGKISLGEQFLRNISIEGDDVGFGQIDPLTGEIINTIPKYFINEIDGEYSTDLFKNMALYNDMALKFKYLSEIDEQAEALVRLEKNKQAIATSIFGKTQKKNGIIQYTPDNSSNSGLVEDMMKAIVYRQKYVESEAFDQILGKLGSFGKTLNDKLGFHLLPEHLEGRSISLNKAITQLNNTFQITALGLNPLSSASNFFGGFTQSLINSGTYFTKNDFISTEMWLLGNKMAGKEDRKLLMAAMDYFVPFTETINSEMSDRLSITKINDQAIQDFLLVMMRHGDKAIQAVSFFSYLRNSIVENGEVVNTRQFLKASDEYKDFYKGTKQERDERANKFEEDVKKLNDEKGVLKLGKIENNEFVIPGVERKSQSVVELRRKVQQITNDALGNASEETKRLINMTVYGNSFMIFKNWIPRLIDVRTGNLKYNAASDAYEWGRTRMIFRIIGDDFIGCLSNLTNALQGTDKGMDYVRQLYEKKKEDYENDTGKELKLTESQFIDLVRQNIKNQILDALLYATLFALVLGIKAIPPDKDEDPSIKNSYNFLLKITDKFKDEVGYFYDPTSLSGLVSSGLFPSSGLIGNFKDALLHFYKENYGLITHNNKLVEKNETIKYWLKTFPITNQAAGLLPIFYPNLAKDLGIRMQSQYGFIK